MAHTHPGDGPRLLHKWPLGMEQPSGHPSDHSWTLAKPGSAKSNPTLWTLSDCSNPTRGVEWATLDSGRSHSLQAEEDSLDGKLEGEGCHCDMIWYDMIWYDLIWYDMIWYDMIWYDMIWYLHILLPYHVKTIKDSLPQYDSSFHYMANTSG